MSCGSESIRDMNILSQKNIVRKKIFCSCHPEITVWLTKHYNALHSDCRIWPLGLCCTIETWKKVDLIKVNVATWASVNFECIVFSFHAVGVTWVLFVSEEPLTVMCKPLCLDRFSAEGTPFTMDSEGVVRMMNTSLATTWTQVANTRDQVSLNGDRSC